MMKPQQIRLFLATLLLSICISGCGRSTAKEAQLISVPGLSGDNRSIAWIDDWLIIEHYDDPTYAYSPRLWRVHPDGTGLEQMPIPDFPGCQQNAFVAPTRLPNGELGYLVRCLTPIGNSEVHMMAYQLVTRQTMPLLNYPIDATAIGDYSWNPKMTRGITSSANVLQAHLFWFTRDHSETLDLGFPQALNPNWSPNDNQIAFLAAPEQGLTSTRRLDALFNLYLMDTDGASVRPLVQGFQDATTVAWSPDSQWLILQATFKNRFAEQGLWLVNVATGQRTLLVHGDFTGVEWSPKGHQLAALQASETVQDQPRRVVIIDISPFLSSP